MSVKTASVVMTSLSIIIGLFMEEMLTCTFSAELRLAFSCSTTATMGMALDSVTAVGTAFIGTIAFTTLDDTAAITSDFSSLGKGCATISDLECVGTFSAFEVPLIELFFSDVFDGVVDELMSEIVEGAEIAEEGTGAGEATVSDARIGIKRPLFATLDVASISKASWSVSTDICKYVTPPITSMALDISS